MDKKTALKEIKKYLRLARISNGQKAEEAFKRAQECMHRYVESQRRTGAVRKTVRPGSPWPQLAASTETVQQAYQALAERDKKWEQSWSDDAGVQR